MVTEEQYAAVVQHFMEELSNVLAARADLLARDPAVRERAAELRADWREAPRPDGELLRAAAALARVGVEAHRDALLADAYGDFARRTSTAADGLTRAAGGPHAP